MIKDVLSSLSHIDRISTRVKAIESFLTKAAKEDETGNCKYDNPIDQIQDQVGARITVFYLTDLDIVREQIKKYFRFIEMIDKSPAAEAEFGYVGVHFILRVPDDCIPDDSEHNAPDFFELQIKTLFQHAWSEASHDLGYKSIRDLTSEEKRMIAFTAAQAWGADKIFKELSETLSSEIKNTVQ